MNISRIGSLVKSFNNRLLTIFEKDFSFAKIVPLCNRVTFVWSLAAWLLHWEAVTVGKSGWNRETGNQIQPAPMRGRIYALPTLPLTSSHLSQPCAFSRSSQHLPLSVGGPPQDPQSTPLLYLVNQMILRSHFPQGHPPSGEWQI